MKVTSNFFLGNNNCYVCEVRGQNISTKIQFLDFKHLPGKTNKDVVCVHFISCRVSKVPQGLTKLFPNLQILDIDCSDLKKICKGDLEEYKNLNGFLCDQNEIEFLAGNLFEGFNNLQKISFCHNPLEVIEPTILDGLDKLNHVDFSNFHDEDFECCFSFDPDEGNLTLDEVKEKLFKTFYQSEPENIKRFIQKFQNRIKWLTVSNNEFKAKIVKLEEKEQLLLLDNNNYRAVNEILQNKNKQAVDNENNLKMEIEALKNHQIKLNKEVLDLSWTKVKNNSKAALQLKQPIQFQNDFHADIENFLRNPKFGDIRIQIDEEEYKAQKFILAARSPKLAEIFLKNPEAEILKLVDISVATFEQIFHFIYNDELPHGDQMDFLQIYTAAVKLGINKLKIIAELKVFELINPINAVEVLELSNKFKNYGMRQKAFLEVKKAHPEVPDGWIDKPDKVKKFIEVFGEN